MNVPSELIFSSQTLQKVAMVAPVIAAKQHLSLAKGTICQVPPKSIILHGPPV